MTEDSNTGAIAPVDARDMEPAAPQSRKLVDAIMEAMRSQAEVALGESGVSFDLFRLGVARALQRDPKLERCSKASLAGAILDCARLGLVPAGYDAQAAIVARGSEATLMVMVGGLVDLAMRGGTVVEIGAETVRASERFERDPIADTISHSVTYPRPTEIVAAYAWAKMADGSKVFEIVDKAEIDAAMRAGSGGPAWKTWQGEMAKKVAKRRLVRARRLISARVLASASGGLEIEGDRGGEFIDAEPVERTDQPARLLAGKAAILAAAREQIAGDVRAIANGEEVKP